MFSQCNDIHCVCDMLLRIHGHPIRGIWWCASAEVDSLRMRAAYVLACVGVERRKQRGLLISWLCCFSSLLSRLVCFSLPIVDSPFFASSLLHLFCFVIACLSALAHSLTSESRIAVSKPQLCIDTHQLWCQARLTSCQWSFRDLKYFVFTLDILISIRFECLLQ